MPMLNTPLRSAYTPPTTARARGVASRMAALPQSIRNAASSCIDQRVLCNARLPGGAGTHPPSQGTENEEQDREGLDHEDDGRLDPGGLLHRVRPGAQRREEARRHQHAQRIRICEEGDGDAVVAISGGKVVVDA